MSKVALAPAHIVSQTLPDELLQAPRAGSAKTKFHRRIALSAYAKRLQKSPGEVARDALRSRANRSSAPRAFRAGQPALDAFPADLWAQVATRRLRRVSTNLLAGGEALGYRPLRDAVAEYLNTSRGVHCSAEQVLIISGVQEAWIAQPICCSIPATQCGWRSQGIPERLRVLCGGREDLSGAGRSQRVWTSQPASAGGHARGWFMSLRHTSSL